MRRRVPNMETAASEVATSLRLPRTLIERADALVPKLLDHPEVVAWATPTRSSVLRAAMVVGLAELEKRYGRP